MAKGSVGWLAAILLFACSSGGDDDAERVGDLTQTSTVAREYWFDGMSPISIRGDHTFQFRRNNVSFLAWARTLEGGRKERRRVLLHFDAHSDAHPAPVPEDTDAIRQMNWDASVRYAAALPISAFIMPALHYGWIDEVYWIQPPTSGFRGPSETVRFDLDDSGHVIRPRRSTSSNPNSSSPVDDPQYWVEESQKLLRGEPVSRAFELSYAYRIPVTEWAGDSFTFHFLSLEQMKERVDAGDLNDCEVLLDLDLDYFGSAGPLRAYGLLSPAPQSDVAAGSKGTLVPFFRLDPATASADFEQIEVWMRELRPRVTTVSESPDHSLRDRLPQYCRRALGARSETDPMIPAQVRIGSSEPTGDVSLRPECQTWVDLGTRDSLAVTIEWETVPAESIEVSVYFDPKGARDILAARWWVEGGRDRVRFAVPLPLDEESRFLDNGWDLELRRNHDGLLLWTAGFSLDRNGARRRRVERSLSATESELVGTNLDVLPVTAWIEWAEKRGWSRDRIHELLLADPRTYEANCEARGRLRPVALK